MMDGIESVQETRTPEKTPHQNPKADAPQAYGGLVALFGAILDQARASMSLITSAPSAETEAIEEFEAIEEIETVETEVEVTDLIEAKIADAGEAESSAVPVVIVSAPQSVANILSEESAMPNAPRIAVLQQANIEGEAQQKVAAQSSDADSVLMTLTDDAPSGESNLRALFARALVRQQSQSLGEQNPAAPSSPQNAAPVVPPPGNAEAAPTVHGPQTAKASAPELPQPAQVEVRQLDNFSIRTVRYLAGRTSETVSIRLVPQSLGEMHIAVRSGTEGLEVIMTASSHAARELLEAQAAGLRDTLVKEGIEVSKVTIQSPPSGDLGPGQSGQGRLGTSGRGADYNAPSMLENPETGEHQREGPTRSAVHEGHLNMFV